MTSYAIPTDALKNGKLRFAIVESFDSSTMAGTVRIVKDNSILPFAYTDGRFTRRENDGTPCYNEVDTPANGFRALGWPVKGYPIMVDCRNDRVSGWSWPASIIGATNGINDHRYLKPPNYSRQVRFPGLHCVVDVTTYSPDEMEELAEPDPDFPSPALYVGHHTDDFLARTDLPTTCAIFVWDPDPGMSRLVSLIPY